MPRTPEDIASRGTVAEGEAGAEIEAVVILDPDATDERGHYLPYDRRLSVALGEVGAAVTVACRWDLDPDLLPDVQVVPVFEEPSRRLGKSVGDPAAAARFREALGALIARLPVHRTRLYLYVGSHEHAAIIAEAIAPHDHLSAVVNLFYEAFADCRTPAHRSRWRAVAWSEPLATARLRLTVPTDALRTLIAEETARWHDVAPHPSTAFGDGEAAAIAALPLPSLVRKPIIYLAASSRDGKGFTEGLAAAARIAGEDRQVVLRHPYPGEQPDLEEAIDALPAGVTVLRGALDPDDYVRVLRDADIVVLPYEAEAFRMRTSGVMIDALSLGKPVVTVAGSWLGEVTRRLAAGTAIDQASPDAVAEAVEAMLSDLAGARSRAEAAGRAYTAGNRWRDLARDVLAHDGSAEPAPLETVKAGGERPRRLLVIGNGPSAAALAEAGFENLPPGIDTIGMGAAYRHFERAGWWPTYYALADTKVVFSHRGAFARLMADPAVTTKRFFLAGPFLREGDDAADRLEVIPHSSTGSFCLRKAIDLGYDEVFLIGVEGRYVEEIAECRPLRADEVTALGYDRLGLSANMMSLLTITRTPEANPNYFFHDYQREGDVYSLPRAHTHLSAWRTTAAIAEAAGRAVYNLSGDSAVTDFPRLSLNAFLAADEIASVLPLAALAAHTPPGMVLVDPAAAGSAPVASLPTDGTPPDARQTGGDEVGLQVEDEEDEVRPDAPAWSPIRPDQLSFDLANDASEEAVASHDDAAFGIACDLSGSDAPLSVYVPVAVSVAAVGDEPRAAADAPPDQDEAVGEAREESGTARGAEHEPVADPKPVRPVMPAVPLVAPDADVAVLRGRRLGTLLRYGLGLGGTAIATLGLTVAVLTHGGLAGPGVLVLAGTGLCVLAWVWSRLATLSAAVDHHDARLNRLSGWAKHRDALIRSKGDR